VCLKIRFCFYENEVDENYWAEDAKGMDNKKRFSMKAK
jgi:hypothetical protein